jgi:hypothetical protein
MPHLRLIEPEQASGRLREIYERMQARPLPPAYRPHHGGLAGIIRAHSLDPELMLRVFSLSANVNGQGPLSWPQREFVNTLTSRLNQCFY